MRIVVAGGAGFIGSNFVHHLLKHFAEAQVIVVDSLTYAGNLQNLESVASDERFRFVKMDIADPQIVDVLAACDVVVNFAAESHVDRSIENAKAFVRTNVEGTYNLLQASRVAKVGRFVQIGTDEVYGSLGSEGKFTETTPLSPNSPYAATKAAADLLVLSFVHTFGFPAIITRCSNNYGPFQFPEKFIPLMITQAMAGEPLPVYGDGMNVRDWIHVEDHCSGVCAAMQKGRDGEVYNLGGECEMHNLDVVLRILEAFGRPRTLVNYVADRLGHDRRYAIDCSKVKSELGWSRRWDFDKGLQETIGWYRENQLWLEGIRTGAYLEYMKRHYTERASLLQSLSTGASSN
jgi:dTDP-glucose 4,6-dehydratase